MAAYNGAALICETIDSLLAQTFGDFELVVVDDCSADDTLALLRSYTDPRIRVFASEANGGPVRARNRAFTEARGRYIAGLDQDDLCRPERFARQVAYLDANPDVVLAATATIELKGTRTIASQLPPVTTPALIEWLIHVQNPLAWSSVMFRADAARAFPEMTRPELLYAEDFDLYHRLSKVGRIARIDEPLLVYRSHEGGASQRYTDQMHASAGAVLAEQYRPLFGDEAEAAAALIVRHVMSRTPVPDADALRRVGSTVAALQEAYLAHTEPHSDDRALIRWETARLWARIGQAALRSGAVGLAATLRNRPDHLGLGYAGIDALVTGRMIGAARNMRGRPRA